MSNVYAIQHPHGFFKVGMSKKPFKRYETFRVASPYELVLHTIMSTDDEADTLEKRIHEKLSDYHWRGEWFNVPEQILESAFQECIDDDTTTAYHMQQVKYVKDSEQRKDRERSKTTEFTKATEL